MAISRGPWPWNRTFLKGGGFAQIVGLKGNAMGLSCYWLDAVSLTTVSPLESPSCYDQQWGLSGFHSEA
eukprot:11341252-Prorocentrum_lima.AAC.1